MTLVTVVTPAHNAAGTIRRCHESIRAQTLTDWEHIIVDDGSTDDTSAVLDQLRMEDDRVRGLTLGTNQGAGSARNAAIAQASGRFIAFIDSDDEWLPEKLETQIAFMQKEGVDLSYGAYRITDGASSQVLAEFHPPCQLTYKNLLGGCPLGCLTVAFDRDSLGTHYMPDIRRGQDWGLWLKLARRAGRIAAYPGVHAVYYRNAGSVSSQKLRKFFDVWRIYRDSEGLSIPATMRWMSAHLAYLAWKRRKLIEKLT
jgi:teichuronic acid biosynthesis glycosyltransferase TuaG